MITQKKRRNAEISRRKSHLRPSALTRMTRARYVAMRWDWPLQIPCPFCVRDIETGECVLFPDSRGELRPNMRTMAAAEKRAAKLNRAQVAEDFRRVT